MAAAAYYTVMRRSLQRAEIDKCMLLICDIQDKFSPLIYRGDTVINRAALLNDACKVLNIPVVVTEQYPKTFGKTVPELVLREDITEVYEKRRFSMLTDDVWPMLKGQLGTAGGRKQFILVGVEAHVCLQQTALDLISCTENHHGDVFVVCDAVSSQRPHDRAVALNRLKEAGAVLTTAESLLFDLLRDSTHPDFKTISGLIKAANAKGNEFAADTTL